MICELRGLAVADPLEGGLDALAGGKRTADHRAQLAKDAPNFAAHAWMPQATLIRDIPPSLVANRAVSSENGLL